MTSASVTPSLSAAAFLLVATLAATGCAVAPETPSDTDTDDTTAEEGQSAAELRISFGLGANGDSCTAGTNPDGTTIPGTEKDGECCSTADPTKCIIILKPFPSAVAFRR